MTRPEEVIEQQRRKVADMERALETARAELRGMEMLASAFGNQRPFIPAGVLKAATASGTAPERAIADARQKGPVGGRQPGSISMRWREVLKLLLMVAGEWFQPSDVVHVVHALEDREIKPSEVRRQFEGYMQYGYVERREDGRYRVTPTAIEKFGLREAPAAAGSETEEGNEAPHSDAGGAPETGEVAASPIESRQGFMSLPG